jgi:tetratricopeptide (TPR) repeat protein
VHGYTTQDVARLLSLTPAQIRSWTRAGFLTPARGPRGEPRFAFQDLVLLRAAKGLMAARVPAASIRRSLKTLKQQLPRGRALSELRITAEGDEIVARDGALAWEPDSGQVVLDFTTAQLAQRAAPMARRQAALARQADTALDAEGWFTLGLELEIGSSDQEARDAYRRALELDPHHADAHVNLGRLLQEAGRIGDAEGHYHAALTTNAEHATAWYNLGTVLEDEKQLKEAIGAYEQSIRADPKLADAYFNLSRLYERVGKRAAALRALSKYQVLTERG